MGEKLGQKQSNLFSICRRLGRLEEWDLKVLDAHYNQPIGLKTTSSSGYKTSPSAGGEGLRIFKIRRYWEKPAVYSAERTAVVPS